MQKPCPICQQLDGDVRWDGCELCHETRQIAVPEPPPPPKPAPTVHSPAEMERHRQAYYWKLRGND